jgi:hypothetical protein
VKLIRSTAGALTFHLDTAEHGLFVEMLGLYPVVPGAHQRLSKTLKSKAIEEGQTLLNEALAEQRTEHKREIEAWLGAPKRFRPVRDGFHFSLQRNDAEWLLQVLNDVRVGSWLLLGSPEEHLEFEELESIPPELHRAWVSMELSGMFQMTLLHALEGRARG